jgi:hypothetical protein
MFEAESKTVNEIPFKVVPFPAAKALRLQHKLVKIIGPAFGRLIGSLSSGDTDQVGKVSLGNIKIDGFEVSQALESLFSQLSEDEFMSLIKELFSGVSCEVTRDGKSVLIDFQENFEARLDIVFQRKLFTIYPVIFFVLEVNFPDFFGQLEGIGNRLQTILSMPGKESAGIY